MADKFITRCKDGLLSIFVKVLRKLGLLRFAFCGHEKLNALGFSGKYSQAQTADGPIPPSKLIFLVAGSPDVGWFLSFGKSMFQVILSTLRKNNAPVETMRSVLEFGCGCGRVLRYWSAVHGPEIHGVDYNPKLIKWCRKNLPFARFETNNLTPPLVYADDMFDCIYAISVFTHLAVRLQVLWMKELTRILKPGGYLLITTHGKSYYETLTKQEQSAFDAGQVVVRYEEASGMNLCSTFHPEAYVRQQLATGYSVSDFVPAETQEVLHQDLYLMKKN